MARNHFNQIRYCYNRVRTEKPDLAGRVTMSFTIGAGGLVENADVAESTVDEIGLFATILITPDNHRVVVPNSKVTSGSIVNLTVLGTRRGDVDVGVAYGTDPREVIDVLVAAGAGVDGCLSDPDPAALLLDFGASSVNFKLRAWSKAADLAGVMAQVRIAAYEALNAAGIEIPFDQIVVHKAAACGVVTHRRA